MKTLLATGGCCGLISQLKLASLDVKGEISYQSVSHSYQVTLVLYPVCWLHWNMCLAEQLSGSTHWATTYYNQLNGPIHLACILKALFPLLKKNEYLICITTLLQLLWGTSDLQHPAICTVILNVLQDGFSIHETYGTHDSALPKTQEPH